MNGQMQMELDVSIAQPAFLILPLSYDKGWIVRTSAGTIIPVDEYKGVMQIQLQEGAYHLSFVYAAYRDSLYQTSVVYISGLVFCTIVLDVQRVYLAKKRSRATRRGHTE